MIDFKFITVNELRNWWPTIKPGLEKIKKRSPENWIPEDVYTDCFNQKTMLWVGVQNNHYKGFLILTPMGETLHVWAAYSLENNYQIVENGLQFVKELAKNHNFKFLTFSSHRRGWDRRAADYGFRPRQWICEV